MPTSRLPLKLKAVRVCSVVLHPSCLLLTFAFPIFALTLALNLDAQSLMREHGITDVAPSLAQLSPWQRYTYAGLSLVSAVLVGVALYHLARCFREISQGRYFGFVVVRAFSSAAGWMFAYVLAGVVLMPADSALLSWHFPPGTRVLFLKFGIEDLITLLFAGTLWTISAAMAAGQRLAQENAEFI